MRARLCVRVHVYVCVRVCAHAHLCVHVCVCSVCACAPACTLLFLNSVKAPLFLVSHPPVSLRIREEAGVLPFPTGVCLAPVSFGVWTPLEAPPTLLLFAVSSAPLPLKLFPPETPARFVFVYVGCQPSSPERFLILSASP